MVSILWNEQRLDEKPLMGSRPKDIGKATDETQEARIGNREKR